ncbi:hypothetical protein TVAG_067220 [Trichomonas vaginalis G3]|uniref:Uncharacterized protein n=1 Tax=Trichomonas vaginalis (strain ATCC PRA-98 / G3) TaxID=412133 RepID=A2DSD8_TRIV3|nr:spectrin binding [Trichomonas vaginalis G3]EAY16717.1 hypothetical protein TVAG_067220 [Trichomonas vaginalis G3]KAI5543151.1 spectrin binding [Trichomonas vaginalis G3]|eukprot:XP_001328940.1 hypothetical protein [Trichomonas vaginalis G3]
MKFNIFDGIIDFISKNSKQSPDSTNEIKRLQAEIKSLQNQIQNASKATTTTRTNESHNFSSEFLTKISSLKKAKDFDRVYKFFVDLSSKNNREMISKACEEGLWKKTTEDEKNVLHIASENGNLNLVKSLIDCGCDKETKDKHGWTPLILASAKGHLEVVKYLISVGADKDAKVNGGYTPLILASANGHLEVVKHIISVGTDKEAKTNGKIALKYARDNVRDFLISIGAK